MPQRNLHRVCIMGKVGRSGQHKGTMSAEHMVDRKRNRRGEGNRNKNREEEKEQEGGEEWEWEQGRGKGTGGRR